MLIGDASEEQINCWFCRGKELGMEKICAFAVVQMSKLFHCNNIYAVTVAEEILSEDPRFVHTVISPKEKKQYVFSEKDIEERFFADNRRILLTEV